MSSSETALGVKTPKSVKSKVMNLAGVKSTDGFTTAIDGSSSKASKWWLLLLLLLLLCRPSGSTTVVVVVAVAPTVDTGAVVVSTKRDVAGWELGKSLWCNG